jgi:hypothetical protein
VVRYRFSIRSLILLTTVIAVVLALLRYPTRLTASAAVSAMLAALAASMIGALTSQGRIRAFCAGYLVAGSIHAALAFTSWFGQGAGQMLFSCYLLNRLAPIFGNHLMANMAIEEPLLFSALLNFVPGSPPALYYKYMVIGQSLFTLASGAIGGCLGAYLYARSAICNQPQLADCSASRNS